MKKSLVKIAVFVLAAALLLPMLVSCKTDLSSSEEESAVVMTVGGLDVPYEVYRYCVLNYKKQLYPDEAVWSDESSAAEAEEDIRESALLAIRRLYAVFSLARDYGFSEQDDVIKAGVDTEVQNKIDSCGSEKDYKKELEANFMTDNVYRLLAASQLCSVRLQEEMAAAGDIQRDKDALRDILYSGQFIRVKQILVVGDSSSDAYGDMYFSARESHTDEEARAIAETAASRAAAGEDFDALVAEYGESLFMFNNTDGYYLCRGMWDSVNEEAAFALSVGQTSGVVVSDKGYSVFKRDEKDKEYIEAHFDELCDNYESAAVQAKLDGKISVMPVVTGDGFDAFSIRDMK